MEYWKNTSFVNVKKRFPVKSPKYISGRNLYSKEKDAVQTPNVNTLLKIVDMERVPGKK